MSRILLSFCIVSVVFAHMCAGQGSPECEVNSEPKPCGKLCEPTCDNPRKRFCNPADKNRCRNECRCLDGTVRNPQTGHCVAVHECPKKPPKCPCNEELSLCGKMCESTCAAPRPNPLFCPRIQCTRATEACRCQDGYLRNASEKCVLPKYCSISSGD